MASEANRVEDNAVPLSIQQLREAGARIIELESQATAAQAEIHSLREELGRWRKGYNSVTKSHYQTKIESLAAWQTKAVEDFRDLHIEIALLKEQLAHAPEQ